MHPLLSRSRWASLLALTLFSACATHKPHTLGPGHDADWPIEAPDAPAYEAYLRADRLSQQGKVDEAISILEEGLKSDSDSPFLLIALAEEHIRKGDLEKGELAAKKAVASDPKYARAYFLLGKIHAARQEWDQSEEAFRKVISLDTDDDGEGAIALATVYLETKHPEKARDVLEQLVKASPNHLFGWYYLGRVHSEQNHFDEALRAYERAVEINPGFTAALKSIALLYEYQGKKEKAVDTYRRILDVEPDDANTRNHLGQYYLEQDDMNRALAEFEIVARDHPEDLTTRLRIGLIYLRQTKYLQAEKTFRELLRDSPNAPRIHYYLAVVLEHRGELSEAQRHLKEVKPDSDVYVESQIALSYLRENSGDLKEAERVLKEAIAAKPAASQLYAAQASLLSKQKRFTEAKALLDAALTKMPKDETLWFALGELQDKMGNFAELEKCMRTVLDLNADNASALNYLGYSFAEKGVRLDEAEQLIKRALHMKKNDGYITDSLGWVYYKRGMYAEAVKTLEEANKLSPNETVVLEHLADALIKNGDSKRAKEIYQQAIKVSKDDEEKKRIRGKLEALAKK